MMTRHWASCSVARAAAATREASDGRLRLRLHTRRLPLSAAGTGRTDAAHTVPQRLAGGGLGAQLLRHLEHARQSAAPLAARLPGRGGAAGRSVHGAGRYAAPAGPIHRRLQPDAVVSPATAAGRAAAGDCRLGP